MKKIKVLHIGIKNWPFESTFSTKDKRGGGSNKYTNLLLDGYSDKVKSYVITRQVKNQKKREIYANGITVYRIKSFGGRKLSQVIFNLKGIFTSIKLIKNEEIDVIHGHMLIGIIFSYPLGKLFSIPVVGTPYSVYTTQFGFPLIKITKILERFFYKLLDALVFESQENKKMALNHLKVQLPKSEVIVTGINFPTVLSSMHDPSYYLSHKIRILFIGRLVKIKALDNLINGISKLSKKNRDKILLDIIGEGEEFTKLKRIINKNDLNKTVFLRNFVNRVDVYLKNSDIFILPSHMEGLSISLLEAMSSGLACIVNNFGVPFSEKEIYIMKNNHPKTIAKSLTEFIERPELINKFKENAIKIVHNCFSIEKFAEKHYTLYLKVL